MFKRISVSLVLIVSFLLSFVEGTSLPVSVRAVLPSGESGFSVFLICSSYSGSPKSFHYAAESSTEYRFNFNCNDQSVKGEIDGYSRFNRKFLWNDLNYNFDMDKYIEKFFYCSGSEQVKIQKKVGSGSWQLEEACDAGSIAIGVFYKL
ncbi:hypothetical protein BWQ96_04965 [Gracilariopsis chorda]|uniref:S-protein homolog n=1 Tax=Gracilariopsis chorda TaxID=448386 RepID=A0A2V3IT17_9FLOR|nr:hypothetical protein BWQ96_04965 [Gracilariopsis chorda]|eukprot:PXF45266.1 hypothetical protein BWQ96_04965 [Gracilariopsis chorda]